MTESPFSSVLVVNYVVQDGKSNWLEGFVLMSEFIRFLCWIVYLIQNFSALSYSCDHTLVLPWYAVQIHL